jgi:hypothetical protein
MLRLRFGGTLAARRSPLKLDLLGVVGSCRMGPVAVLEWSFSPADYFEVPIEIRRDNYTLTVAHGKARATLDSAAYDRNPAIRRTLHEALNDRFLGVQLLNHRAYELSSSSMTRVHPDGRRDVFLEAEPGRIVVTGHPVDFQIRDKDGNIIADSKRDRIEKKKILADLVSTYRSSDRTLASLLRSHDAAVRDASNEFVHLHEIREALSLKFGGDKKARSALGISPSDWSRFGRLCNNEPLRQGRHRGKTGAALRDATEPELAETRDIARRLIEAYLRHLDTFAPSGGNDR